MAGHEIIPKKCQELGSKVSGKTRKYALKQKFIYF